MILLRTFLFISLNDAELYWVFWVLHDVPIECLSVSSEPIVDYLLVLPVNLGGLNQFVPDLVHSVLYVSGRNTLRLTGRHSR
jgi:hypothetical protein